MVNSYDSARTVDGRTIVLNEMPRHAGTILQRAKLELEGSGTLGQPEARNSGERRRRFSPATSLRDGPEAL